MHTLVWQGIPKSEDTEEQNFIYFWPYSDLGSGSEVVLHRVYGTGEGGRRRSVQRRQRDQRFFFALSSSVLPTAAILFAPGGRGHPTSTHPLLFSVHCCKRCLLALAPSCPLLSLSLSLSSPPPILDFAPPLFWAGGRGAKGNFFALRSKEEGLRFTDRAN